MLCSCIQLHHEIWRKLHILWYKHICVYNFVVFLEKPSKAKHSSTELNKSWVQWRCVSWLGWPCKYCITQIAFQPLKMFIQKHICFLIYEKYITWYTVCQIVHKRLHTEGKMNSSVLNQVVIMFPSLQSWWTTCMQYKKCTRCVIDNTRFTEVME